MESIVQLLCFEVALGNSGSSWPVHLDAAMVIFEQIMAQHGQDHSLDGALAPWYLVMSRLCPYDRPPGSPHTRPHVADQAALRFYVAILLHFDMVASAVLCRAPRLRDYHAHLLVLPVISAHAAKDAAIRAVGPPGDEYALLDLAEFTGVQNWVVLAIGQISALATWKRDAVAAKKLSVVDLVAQATPVEARLRCRLATMLAARTTTAAPSASTSAMNLMQLPPLHISPESHQHQMRAEEDGSTVNIAWGHAALLYLHVVVNGWQPEADAVREAVDAVLALLQALPTPTCLRVVVWPFCVAGCLARRGQEPEFRRLVAAIGPLDVFGSVKEAMGIMEAVWARRDAIEGSGGDWDLAMCFNVLGRSAFLV